jgi:hypothetical protein
MRALRCKMMPKKMGTIASTLSNAHTPYWSPKAFALSREVLHTATNSDFSRFASARAWK